jgi:hypothetical protein
MPMFIRTFAAVCGPPGPENVSGWQARLPGEFGASPHCLDHPEVLERKHGGILDPGRLAAIFAGPEPTGLFYQERFAGEGPGEVPANLATLHRSIIKEWNWKAHGMG